VSTISASELGQELYELLKHPSGAAVDAIQRKPLLMSFIRAKAPVSDGPSATNEAIAAEAQETIENTTYDLVKPPRERAIDDVTDHGAAARIYLALEGGTKGLSVAARRRQAAPHMDKTVEALGKTQKKPYRKGHELRLMESLAALLIKQETANPGETPRSFDSSFVDRSVASWTQRPLPDYQRAWDIAKLFPGHIASALDCVKRRSADWHRGTKCRLCLSSIGTYARFVTVTEQISDPDHWEMLRKEVFPARAVVAQIQAAAPFGPGDCRQLERGIQVAKSYHDLGELFSEVIFSEWDKWLRSCNCLPAKPDPECPVHQSVLAFAEYAACVENEWKRLHYLQAPTPAEFVEYNERIAFGRIGLSAPG
jgi:hypothetical protein